MTKADRIRALARRAKTNQEIARLVGCSVDYARVYSGQRLHGMSAAERRYREKPAVRAARAASARNRYASDLEYQARRLAVSTRWKKANKEHLAAYYRARRARLKAAGRLPKGQ